MSFWEDASYLKDVQEALKDNPFVENMRKYLHINEVNDEFGLNDGLFYFKDLIYIPPRPIWLKIIQICHNLPVAGHFGFNKTMDA